MALLSGQDLITYRTLFNKSYRDQTEWFILKKLILSADVVFALTEGQDGKYDRNNATVVSVGPIVPAFSTMEAAKEGYKSMENRLKANGKIMVLETGTFLELARYVDKMGATLLLDPNKAGKGISYSNGRIESCFIPVPLLRDIL